MGLQKVELRRKLAPMKEGAAIFLGNEKKTFMMHIGHNEAGALIREFQNQKFVRPLPHDLFHYALLGFDVEVKHVIISGINENTFYATLVMEQKVKNAKDEWTGKRNEVRIDARPSDSIIMAVKANAEIYVADEVLEGVHDVSEELKSMPLLNFDAAGPTPDLESLQFDDMDLELPDTETDADPDAKPPLEEEPGTPDTPGDNTTDA